MNKLLVVLLMSPLVGGCVSNRPLRGSIGGPEIGRRFLDFGFLDDRGRASFLSHQLGDYTVLAFTRCETDTHQPVVGLLESIVAENRGAGSVMVVGIDIHSAEAGCRQRDVCHLVETLTDLISICDTKGAIRRLYDVGQEDRVYLIGPHQRVLAWSLARDAARLRNELSIDVALFADRLAQERLQELDD